MLHNEQGANPERPSEVRAASLIASNRTQDPATQQTVERLVLDSDASPSRPADCKVPDDEDTFPIVPQPAGSLCSSLGAPETATTPGYRVVRALLRASTTVDRKSQMGMAVGVVLVSLLLVICALSFHKEITEATEIQSGLMLGSAGSLTMCAVVIGSFLRTRWYRRHMHILLLNMALCEFALALSFLLEPAWKRVGAGVGSELSCRWLSTVREYLLMCSNAWTTCTALDLYYLMTDPFTSPRMNRRKYQLISHGMAFTSAVIMYASDSFAAPVAVGNFCWVGAQTASHSSIDGHSNDDSPESSTAGVWIFIVLPAVVSMGANLCVTLVSYGRFRDGLAATLRNRRGLLREGFLTTVTLLAYSALLWSVYGVYWLVQSPSTQARTLSRLFAFLLSYRGSVPFVLWCLYKRPQRTKKKSSTVLHGDTSFKSPEGLNQERKETHHVEAKDPDTDAEVETEMEVQDDDAVRPQMNLALLDELVFYTTQGIAKTVSMTGSPPDLQSTTNSPTSRTTDPELQRDSEMTPGPTQYAFVLRPSPSASSWYECRFTAFKPLMFQRIRRFFSIDEDTYLSSLGTCTTPKVSEGASGSFVFFSTDRSFLVKSLTASEAAFLHGMLDEYVAYMESQSGDSFLTRFLGSYCLELYGRPTHFVVMENVFDVQQGIAIHQRYDIKGSWVDRNAQKPRRGAEATCRHCNLSFRCGSSSSRSSSRSSTVSLGSREKQERSVCPNRAGAPHEPNVVLKDMDLTMKLRFGKNAGRKLMAQLMRDSDFLCDRGVTDYSLLLGVIEVSYQVNRQNIFTRDGSVFLPPDGHSPRQDRQPQGKDQQEATGSEPGPGTERVKQSTQCLRASEVVIGPGFYYIGLIDMLQTWTWMKSMERFVKTVLLRKDPDGISAMPPKPYRDRFHRKLREIIHLGSYSSLAPGTIASPRRNDEGGATQYASPIEEDEAGEVFPEEFDDYDRMTRIRPHGVPAPVDCTSDSEASGRQQQVRLDGESCDAPRTPSLQGHVRPSLF